MSYRAEYYNDIFLSMRHQFGENWYATVPSDQWNVWRSRIKKMFDQDIMIREIKLALVEAAGKKKWPAGTSFFARVEDVVLKNRRETRPADGLIDGPVSTGDLMKQRGWGK